MGVADYAGTLLGFQTNSIPKFNPLDELLNLGGTRANLDQMLALLSDLLTAAGEGGGKFLRSTFEQETGRVLGSVAGSREGAIANLTRDFARGSIDPASQAFLTSQVNRDFGAVRGGLTRDLAISESRREEAFPFQVLQVADPIIKGQQGLAIGQNIAENRHNLLQAQAANQQQSNNGQTGRAIIDWLIGQMRNGGGGGGGGGFGAGPTDGVGVPGGGGIPGIPGQGGAGPQSVNPNFTNFPVDIGDDAGGDSLSGLQGILEQFGFGGLDQLGLGAPAGGIGAPLTYDPLTDSFVRNQGFGARP